MVRRPQLTIEETSDLYRVSLETKLLFEIKKDDRLSLKVAIISMINTGLARQVELAKSFYLRRETIANYVKAYKKLGLVGLIGHSTGRHGIPDAIEERIVELLCCTSAKKAEVIKIISQEFGKTISRTKIYEIRKKYLSDIKKQQQVTEKAVKKK